MYFLDVRQILLKSSGPCTYLCDSGCTIEGIRFYGSPWQPAFGDLAFNLQRGQQLDRVSAGFELVRDYGSSKRALCMLGPSVSAHMGTHDVWKAVPEDIDVLITHGPPLGRGDLTAAGERTGCVDLLRNIQNRIRPKLNVFGHIHEGHGVTFDGTTVYANASICTGDYRPTNAPIVLDLVIVNGKVASVWKS